MLAIFGLSSKYGFRAILPQPKQISADAFALLTIPHLVQPFLSCFSTHSSHGWGANLGMAINGLGRQETNDSNRLDGL
jgi:hypothetical protein